MTSGNVKTIKRQIYADLKLADALINDRAVDWTYINGNYHMNFGYSASRLIDTVVFFKILEEVKHQFTYESANYLKGKDQFYKPLDYDGKDKSLIDQFVKTLSDLKLVRTYGRNNETGLKGQCIKYFQNICDYHAKEVLEKIPDIIKQCNENLTDAPILWIARYISSYVDAIKTECWIDDFNFENRVSISQYHCSLPLDDLELYETKLMQKEKKMISDSISKMNEIFSGIVIDTKNEKDYDFYFTNKKWTQFTQMCENSVDETIPGRYVLNGDIMCLYHDSKYECSETHVLLHLNSFNITNALYEVLFPKLTST